MGRKEKKGGEKDRKYDYVTSSETIHYGKFERFEREYWKCRKRKRKKDRKNDYVTTIKTLHHGNFERFEHS